MTLLLRPAKKEDAPQFEKFSNIPGMFNFPTDQELILERIEKSKNSFSGIIKNLPETKYTFVAEEPETKEIVATSMVCGQHGTPQSPHSYFEVGKEERYSSSVSTGFIHGTLTLGFLTDGPSEIGALVVSETHRSSEIKVGKQISFVRFLYMALYPERFKKEVIAELLPPLNKKGLSPLWEAIGRRFTNMDYWEADHFSANNKDFISDLFPTGKIYTTFLPAEARNAIGKIGKDTTPVKHLLEKIGFSYKNQIDPFDGGPHFWGTLSELSTTKNLYKGSYSGTTQEEGIIEGILTKFPDNSFQACQVKGLIKDEKFFISHKDQKIESLLQLKPSDSIAFLPYY